jgi:GT2 family glycosyltransferase
MRISVVVPTFERPGDLVRCLRALQRQNRAPDEVILVTHASDSATGSLLTGYDYEGLPVRLVTVQEPGGVAALNAGLEAASGDVIAFTDDDAAPKPDWLARIEDHFQRDPAVGGVGGRDWIHENGGMLVGRATSVNRIQWFGRVIGNNHLELPSTREVDVLKGVNMSYRRQAVRGVRFDVRLRGTGSQSSVDHAFALRAKRAGWKLLYDPAVAVDHFPGHRPSHDPREHTPAGVRYAAHNETLTLLEHLPVPRRLVFFLYALLVGSWHVPGMAQWIRMKRRGTESPGALVMASLRGRLDGLRTFWQTGRARASAHAGEHAVGPDRVGLHVRAVRGSTAPRGFARQKADG